MTTYTARTVPFFFGLEFSYHFITNNYLVYAIQNIKFRNLI
jgi:hypothetical protein